MIVATIEIIALVVVMISGFYNHIVDIIMTEDCTDYIYDREE